MKRKFIQALLFQSVVAASIIFMSGLSWAQDSLCKLPAGKYSGYSIMIQDKATGKVEKFSLDLNITADHKIGGKIRFYDVDMTPEGHVTPELTRYYFFDLASCNGSNTVFKIKNSELDGYLKVHNVNLTLREITLTGAMQAYSDGVVGMGQWLYDTAWWTVGYDTVPEIDFRKVPVRLRAEM